MIGVDLGPNLSVTGSLATILWLIALRRENLNVSFWDFLKVGVIAMPIALLASVERSHPDTSAIERPLVAFGLFFLRGKVKRVAQMASRCP